jgi:hypothetical protein
MGSSCFQRSVFSEKHVAPSLVFEYYIIKHIKIQLFFAKIRQKNMPGGAEFALFVFQYGDVLLPKTRGVVYLYYSKTAILPKRRALRTAVALLSATPSQT